MDPRGMGNLVSALVAASPPVFIRDDLDVPVLVLNTETDVGSLQARQDDSARYRLWEVAGTAHLDPYSLLTGATDTGERSAIAYLNRWIAFGTPPAAAPRLATVSISPPQYVVDANGNVEGGIRTPAADAPVAKLSGPGQTGATLCFLFGTTLRFTPEQLEALYANHREFSLAWGKASMQALLAGSLRPEDAFDVLIVGAQSEILR